MRIWISALMLMAISCTGTEHREDQAVSYKIPHWFPQFEIPSDNLPTEYRILLGKKLFYSTAISSDGHVSCASCHVTSSAFTDGQKTSMGAHGKRGKRNSPTLANLAWSPYFMMEGGVPTLELQALAPVGDSMELDINIVQLAQTLRGDQEWNRLSQIAYGRDLDEYVITRALACFQRSFISSDSRFDRYYYQNQMDQLNEDEISGMNLFMSERLACNSCHTAPLTTDYQFHNIGLYEVYSDQGKQRETYNASDEGKFKTPTLRNIELTAPYMHDGSINTLEEVIEFYNSGGKNHPLKDPRIRPLKLTEEEKEQLLQFLRSLTDWNFVQNAAFL